MDTDGNKSTRFPATTADSVPGTSQTGHLRWELMKRDARGVKASVHFSSRYMVMGVYLDRDKKALRIYPIPFVRVSVNR